MATDTYKTIQIAERCARECRLAEPIAGHVPRLLAFWRSLSPADRALFDDWQDLAYCADYSASHALRD